MSLQQTAIAMMAGHLIADYTLQGWLANGKQKSWWLNQTKDTKYRFDYIAALICHSLYWSIFICLPFWNHPGILVSIIVNTMFHALVDDLKANKMKLNLIEDQLLHLLQMSITFVAMIK